VNRLRAGGSSTCWPARSARRFTLQLAMESNTQTAPIWPAGIRANIAARPWGDGGAIVSSASTRTRPPHPSAQPA
jgi:hypothetical protein